VKLLEQESMSCGYLKCEMVSSLFFMIAPSFFPSIYLTQVYGYPFARQESACYFDLIVTLRLFLLPFIIITIGLRQKLHMSAIACSRYITFTKETIALAKDKDKRERERERE